jgi:hypothetical protein
MLSELLWSTLVAAFGVLLWVKAWHGWRLRVAMRRWPRTPASIHGYRSRASSTSVHVDVEVSYRHDGRDYRVWCRTPMRTGYGRGSPMPERQVAAVFPVGTTHPAYVNPANPAEAFLKLPEPHMLAAFVGFGAILVGLATALALPVAADIGQELATLWFFLLVGAVLSVLVVFFGVALYRLPRPHQFGSVQGGPVRRYGSSWRRRPSERQR